MFNFNKNSFNNMNNQNNQNRLISNYKHNTDVEEEVLKKLNKIE